MKPLRTFLLWTYGLFLAGFAAAGLLISFDGPATLVLIIQIAMAWTPTVAFLMIRRRVEPNRSLWRSISDRFRPPVRPSQILIAVFLPALVTGVVWMGYALFVDRPVLEFVADLSFGGVALLLASHLIRGPLGEELGWRGYMLGELTKRHSLLKSSIIVGLAWGLWHLPLWFVSGYQGLDLVLYSVSFFVAIVAFSVIIAFTYRGGNLLIPVLLHLMFNFTGGLLTLDTLTTVVGSSIVYGVIAVAIGITSTRPTRRTAAAR